MVVNFEIENNYAVTFENKHIDLHNNFDLLKTEKLDQSYKLIFQKNEGNWVNDDEFDKLTFIFEGITNFYHQKGNNTEFPEDENTLSTVTFFPSSVREINTSFTLQRTPLLDDDIIFAFENGKVYRFTCKEVKLICEQ